MISLSAPPSGAAHVESPYVGLSCFSEDDASLFFGRDPERQVIMGNLRASRLTLLYGASGVGKSSLLRAGVAARLRELAQFTLSEGGSSCYVPVVFSSWKDDPVQDLIRHVEATANELLPTGMRVALPRGSLLSAIETAVRALERGAVPDDVDRPAISLVVMLDQFEEYLLYDSTGALADQLGECVTSADLQANFLISIREDLYATLGDLLTGRLSNVYGNYLHLEYLAPEAAREAIEKPIERYNAGHPEAEAIVIEPGLVDVVLAQVQRDTQADQPPGGSGPAAPSPQIVTPYLQLVMTALWEREMRHGSHTLRRATLKELQGAEKIVAGHLEAALNDLPSQDRELAVDVLHHLVTPSGTKIALEVSDLSEYTRQPPHRVAAVLTSFAGAARILREVPPAPGKSPNDETARRFEIYHDVLAGPINDAVRAAATRRLERDKRAAEARARRERKHARVFKALAVGSISALIVAIAGGALATVERNHARQAQRVGLSRQLAAQALADFQSDAPDRAVLLSMEAYAVGDTADARTALVRALVTTRDMRAYVTGHTAAVTGVAFSTDGRLLATASDDGTAIIRDARTRRTLAVLRGHARGLSGVAFAPDARFVATAGGADRTVMLWDPRSGRRIRTVRAASPIESVAVDATGRIVAAAADNGTVVLWDARSGRRLRTLRGQGDPVLGVAFAPRGRLLASVASGDVDGAAILWDARTGRRLRTLEEPNPLTSVAFSPDGTALALGSVDLSAVIRDTRTGRRLAVLGEGVEGAVQSVAFGSTADTLVAGDEWGTTVVWDVRSSRAVEVLRGHTDAVTSVGFSPDGQTVASGGDDNATILWRAGPPPGARVLTGHADVVNSVAFSPDGTTVASAGFDQRVVLWDVPSGRRLATLLGHSGQVESVAFSPDGRSLASAGVDRTVILWNVATGDPVRTLRGHGDVVYGVAFSPDGRMLASAGADRTVRIWDVRTGWPLRVLRGHTNAVDAVAFSPGGSVLASAGSDNAVILWDAVTGRRERRLTTHSHVTSVAFLPDGKTLVSAGANRAVTVWNVETGQRVGDPMTGQQDKVTSLAVSPDGKTIASAGGDGSIVVWSGETRLGRPVGAHTGPVMSVAFSPDGRTIASGSADQTVMLSPVPGASSLSRRLCGVVGRSLNRAEWDQFVSDEPYRRTCPQWSDTTE
jgi:WD40 repeat protein